jgi:hypothetical protein
VAGILASVLEYNRMKPTQVIFSLDGNAVPADRLCAEVVCEHPGLKIRVEPEEEQDQVVRQMEEVISLTPSVMPRERVNQAPGQP